MKPYVKVAIIGAGLSGLACALELEKHGIEPVIFERNDSVGEIYPHAAALMQIFRRPVRYPLQYLSKNYGIELKPINPLRHVIMKGANSESKVSGNLGVFLTRGHNPDCVEKQLEAKLKSKINFNQHADYNALRKEFDYVVVATGNDLAAKELGCWQEIMPTVLYGAVILGHFKTDTLIAYFNTRYAKNGYAYITPFNENRASLVLVLPNTEKPEAPDYWSQFIREEKIRNEIVQYFITEHKSGFVFPKRIGNIILTGAAAGATESFLGFGSEYSLVSGVCAARSIVSGLDYEEQIKNHVETNKNVNEFRMVLNSFNNSKFDILIKTLGFPVVRNIVYNTNIDMVKHGARVLRLSRQIRKIFYRSRSSLISFRNK